MNENLAIFGLMLFILYIVFYLPIERRDKSIREVLEENRSKYRLSSWFSQMKF